MFTNSSEHVLYRNNKNNEISLSMDLVQIGIRTATAHHREQFERFNVNVCSARDTPHSASEISHKLQQLIPEPVADRSVVPVYLTLDMDVLDPAFAPGVSHIEPGGLSTRQVLDIILGLPEYVQLIGADLVELNPARDVNGITSMVAAKLVKEILGKLLLQSRVNS